MLKATKMRGSCFKSLLEQRMCKQTNRQTMSKVALLTDGVAQQPAFDPIMSTFFILKNT